MKLKEAVDRAVQEPTLVEALTWAAIWENDRAVRQALRGERGPDGQLWDTCFKLVFQEVMDAWEIKQRGIWANTDLATVTTPNPGVGPAIPTDPWTPSEASIEAMMGHITHIGPDWSAADCGPGHFCKPCREACQQALECARTILGVPALLAENTRLRALLVAEKRAHADLLDAYDMASGFTGGEESRPLRAEADALERGEG